MSNATSYQQRETRNLGFPTNNEQSMHFPVERTYIRMRKNNKERTNIKVSTRKKKTTMPLSL